MNIVYRVFTKAASYFKPSEEEELQQRYNRYGLGDKYEVTKPQNDELIILDLPLQRNIYIRQGSSDKDVFFQILVKKEYEALVKIINKEEVKTILDIGGNIGLTSIYFGAIFKTADIYCIEPDLDNFTQIEKNVNGNNRIYPVNKAIWWKNTKLKLERDFRDKRDWAIRVKENENAGDIESVTIQDLCKEHSIDVIDVLKIDIEGAEKEIFELGAIDDVLTKTKFIAIEIHDEFDCRQYICDTLSRHSFYWTQAGELVIGYNKKLVNRSAK